MKVLQVKVGPHGYIHNWIFVGVPVAGGRVFHPQYGHGTVHTHTPSHVDVHFHKDGQTRRFAVKPDAGPNRFEQMTDDQVVGHLGNGTGEAYKYALAELDRRDRAEREDKIRQLYAITPGSKGEADQLYRKLIGRRENPEDAWAHAYGKNTEQLRRDAAIAQLRGQGYKGAGFHELTAKAFKDDAATAARSPRKTRFRAGTMLNKAGEAAGVDPWAPVRRPGGRRPEVRQ